MLHIMPSALWCCLEERGDVDGHRDVIEAVGAILKRNPTMRAKLGEASRFREELLELMERPPLADYYPYGTSTPAEPPADFAALATAPSA